MLLRLLRRLLLMLSRHRGGTASGLWTTASPLAVWERARARSLDLAALHTVWLFSRAKVWRESLVLGGVLEKWMTIPGSVNPRWNAVMMSISRVSGHGLVTATSQTRPTRVQHTALAPDVCTARHILARRQPL